MSHVTWRNLLRAVAIACLAVTVAYAVVGRLLGFVVEPGPEGDVIWPDVIPMWPIAVPMAIVVLVNIIDEAVNVARRTRHAGIRRRVPTDVETYLRESPEARAARRCGVAELAVARLRTHIVVGGVELLWDIPSPAVETVVVVRSDHGLPLVPLATEGMEIVFRGKGTRAFDPDITVGDAYYYAAFGIGPDGSHSTPEWATATLPETTMQGILRRRLPLWRDMTESRWGTVGGRGRR